MHVPVLLPFLLCIFFLRVAAHDTLLMNGFTIVGLEETFPLKVAESLFDCLHVYLTVYMYVVRVEPVCAHITCVGVCVLCVSVCGGRGE